VLDALCYALYGESSGGERNGEQLRSQHAPPSRSTWVRLDFAIGDALFRVFRAPGQERPKQRGGGTTWEQPMAKLWRRVSGASDEEDGEICAERVEKVNAEIIQTLGFSSQQFRQVVVLPQGQFREFLIANSKDRENILSMLFHTDEYQAIALAFVLGR